jgi:FtsH-binding integral membrane protein
MKIATSYSPSMKLIFAFAVWLIMGVILGSGLLMAVHGSPWLLLIGVVGFIFAVGRIGCMAH